MRKPVHDADSLPELLARMMSLDDPIRQCPTNAVVNDGGIHIGGCDEELILYW